MNDLLTVKAGLGHDVTPCEGQSARRGLVGVAVPRRGSGLTPICTASSRADANPLAQSRVLWRSRKARQPAPFGGCNARAWPYGATRRGANGATSTAAKGTERSLGTPRWRWSRGTKPSGAHRGRGSVAPPREGTEAAGRGTAPDHAGYPALGMAGSLKGGGGSAELADFDRRGVAVVIQ